jgi:hypothetical protein
MILDFVSNHVIHGTTARSNSGYEYSASALTDLFFNGAMEGSCGLFSDYFRKILEEFNFEAIVLDMGINESNGLTHVTNVVRAPDEKFYIFDPTFNAVYRSKNGAIADIETLFKFGDVEFIGEEISRNMVIDPVVEHLVVNNDYLKSKKYDFSKSYLKSICSKDYIFYPAMPYGLPFFFEVWEDALHSCGINKKTDLLQYYFMNGEVFSIGGSSEESRYELSALLRKYRIKIQSEEYLR